MIYKEKGSYLFPCLKEHFSENKKVLNNVTNVSKKIFSNHMHDGKMLYILTQHSLYNHKHHPFLCAYQRGQGMSNSNHTCTMINDANQFHSYNRSEKTYSKKLKQDKTYNTKNIWIKQMSPIIV